MTHPLQVMREDRVVAVIRADYVADSLGLSEALMEAGVRAIEFTFTTPDVLAAISAASASGALVGAGTVVTAGQAIDAVAAGARFVVSPIMAPEVVDAVAEVPVIVGALTPTEISAAVAAGAAAVKLFPARIGGPDYLRDLAGPFPGLALLPSGGIDQSNANAYLTAGALAVYAGSAIAQAALVEAGRHTEIARRAAAFLASLG